MIKKVEKSAVWKLSHELGLVTVVLADDGAPLGVLSPAGRHDGEPDLKARHTADDSFHVLAYTPDGVAFLELVGA